MKKAVFLDRDGTINREVDNLRDLSQLHLLPGAARAIARLNKLGYLVIVVTNQPVVARGLITEKELDEIHAVLIDRFKKKGSHIDAVYYCPHHPEANLKKYRLQCRCRKPNIGLIKTAVEKFGVDTKKSFMIGDSTRDVLAGERAGLRTILVKTGYAGKDGKYKIQPDFFVKNLSKAVEIIKKYAK